MMMGVAGFIGALGFASMISRRTLLGVMVGIQLLVLGSTMMFVLAGIASGRTRTGAYFRAFHYFGRGGSAGQRLCDRDPAFYLKNRTKWTNSGCSNNDGRVSLPRAFGALGLGATCELLSGLDVGSPLASARRLAGQLGIALGFGGRRHQLEHSFGSWMGGRRVDAWMDLAQRGGRGDHDRALRDPLGVTLAMLASLVAACTLIGAGKSARQPRASRFYAALGVSASGVALAWFALTPWLALTGTAVVVFGGFLALGSRWDAQSEAVIATRFGWERSWGLILVLLGLCILAGGRAPLSMLHASGEGAWASQAGADHGSDWMGAALLFFGALAQIQPFPLLGWVMSQSEAYSPARVVTSQVFPAWAVFALLIRWNRS